jgi:small subunit ribosomal protein S17
MGRARKVPEGEPAEVAGTDGESPAAEAVAGEAEPAAEDAVAEAEDAVVEAEPADEPPAVETSQEKPPAARPARARKAPAPKKAPAQKPKAEKKPKAAAAAKRERKPIVRLPRPERPRGKRKERRGTVVSSAMDKTIVVRVDMVRPHPEYKKVVRRSHKLHAHDEGNEAKVGDVVRVVETRPLSKTKTWRLAEILEAAK